MTRYSVVFKDDRDIKDVEADYLGYRWGYIELFRGDLRDNEIVFTAKVQDVECCMPQIDFTEEEVLQQINE